MKKQTVIAFGLLLLIPVVLFFGGFLFSLINPEIAAGHPNYVRNWHLLNLVRVVLWWGSMAVAGILWLLACFLVIHAKRRSWLWLIFAVLGPVGFAILATLKDSAPGEPDPYTRFVRKMNWVVRIGYEVCVFLLAWELAYRAMVLKRNLMILYESATTGVSTAQIIAQQNASSGMWAFGEGMEVMYMVVLLYLLWPVVFNVVALAVAKMASPKAS
jgi:hypothetical protein